MQNGFRCDRRGEDNIFIVSSAIELARAQQKGLICVFLDATKAYDRIDRKKRGSSPQNIFSFFGKKRKSGDMPSEENEPCGESAAKAASDAAPQVIVKEERNGRKGIVVKRVVSKRGGTMRIISSWASYSPPAATTWSSRCVLSARKHSSTRR